MEMVVKAGRLDAGFPRAEFPHFPLTLSCIGESLLLVACQIQIAASSACKTGNYQLQPQQSASSAPQRISRFNEKSHQQLP